MPPEETATWTDGPVSGAVRAPRRLRHPGRFRARYGPWALVTGASSGIGREIAGLLAGAGLHLVLVARRRDLLCALADELTARYGVQVRVVDADLATPAGVDAVVAGSTDLDVGLLVAAAGFGTSGAFLDADPAVEADMLDVNCRAVLALTQRFGRRLAARGRGGVVLLASLMGFQGTPHAASYAATKAYVQALAEALHVEWKRLGVDVLAAAPGPVHTGFAARAGMRMALAARPADVAAPVLNALGRRSTVLPGGLAKLLTWSLRPLSRPLRVRMMSVVMRGMLDEGQPNAASRMSRPRASSSSEMTSGGRKRSTLP
ncbi:SDR family NAD(P)-dependent oxidoreductase [Micromonospora sp. NPDC048999]|uniref:SDR family NAD(P)-dependent oxidoreductase n=1 Tax=Micromonospora sp. NPDC048999 TaxID=3155391 RepID=UPI0033F3025C